MFVLYGVTDLAGTEGEDPDTQSDKCLSRVSYTARVLMRGLLLLHCSSQALEE